MPGIQELREKYLVKGKALKEAQDIAKAYPGEVCFFCGVLIGKDYGSSNHSCPNLNAYKEEARKLALLDMQEFIAWMREEKDVEFKLIVEGTEVGQINVPLLDYYDVDTDGYFTVPIIIEINGKLWQLKGSSKGKIYINSVREYTPIKADWTYND